MQFTTSEVRLSYVNVFKTKKTLNGDEKYSVTCLLPKTDKAGYEELMKACNQVFEENKDGKLKGVARPRIPVHDGDGTTITGAEFGPECKGMRVFTASANPEYPPQIVDRRVKPIIDQQEVYSGCYGHVALSIYAYNNASNKGIGFGLNGLQKTRDGEPLGYTFDAKSAFGVIGDQAEGQTDGGVDPLTGLPF